MKFLTIIVPYYPNIENKSLRYTLEKFLSSHFSESFSVSIHIQITVVPPYILKPCIDLVAYYQRMFSDCFTRLTLSFDCREDLFMMPLILL